MAQRSSKRFRSAAFLILKIVISVGLLVMLVRQTDTTALLARFQQMDARWMLAALGLYALMVVLTAWRWKVLLKTQGVKPSLATLTESLLVATFFNNFLPSNIGGDVVRIADTSSLLGSRTAATSVVLVDRVLGLVALIVVAACGSAGAAAIGVEMPGNTSMWLALAGVVGVATPAILRPTLVPRLLVPLRVFKPDWVDERLDRIAQLLEKLNDRRHSLLVAFGSAILIQVIIVVFHQAVAIGLGIPLPFMYAFVMVPASLLVQMVPLSINGFGVREAVFTYFFARLGLSVEAALALSLVSVGLIILFSITGGLLFLFRRGLIPSVLRADTSR